MVEAMRCYSYPVVDQFTPLDDVILCLLHGSLSSSLYGTISCGSECITCGHSILAVKLTFTVTSSSYVDYSGNCN